MRISLLLLFILCQLHVQASPPIRLYMIPGMGTDVRVFDGLELDTQLIQPIPLEWPPYSECRGLNEYAHQFLAQIDTTAPFMLLGVSMGGMLAMELGQLTSPLSIILISSAQSTKGLPFHYKVGRYFPVYQLLGDNRLNKIANNEKTFRDVLKEEDKVLYSSMLMQTGSSFLKWQMKSIVHWKFSSSSSPPILHIHGDNDKILPIKRAPADIIISDGDHKMIVNHRRTLQEKIETYVGNMVH